MSRLRMCGWQQRDTKRGSIRAPVAGWASAPSLAPVPPFPVVRICWPARSSGLRLIATAGGASRVGGREGEREGFRAGLNAKMRNCTGGLLEYGVE